MDGKRVDMDTTSSDIQPFRIDIRQGDPDAPTKYGSRSEAGGYSSPPECRCSAGKQIMDAWSAAAATAWPYPVARRAARRQLGPRRACRHRALAQLLRLAAVGGHAQRLPALHRQDRRSDDPLFCTSGYRNRNRCRRLRHPLLRRTRQHHPPVVGVRPRRGGHFPSLDTPNLLINDIREVFRTVRRPSLRGRTPTGPDAFPTGGSALRMQLARSGRSSAGAPPSYGDFRR